MVSDAGVKPYSYTRKATFAQISASMVVSLTYFLVSVLHALNTVVLGRILNSTQDGVSLNAEQASWFGSLPMLMQPIGAMIGILLQDRLGQRYGLMLSNTIGLVTLSVLYLARTTTAMLASAVLMGLGLGFTEPSGMGYVSEFSEPRLRGVLCSSTLTLGNSGTLVLFLILSLVPWRTSTIIAGGIPILGIALLLLIPDSPVWLLSKGKKGRALKALAWYRGWVTVEEVREEFEDMQAYVKKSMVHEEPSLAGEDGTALTEKGVNSNQEDDAQKRSLRDLVVTMLEKRTMYPLFMICVHMTTLCFAFSLGSRIYLINLFDALKIPISVNWLTVPVGVASVSGYVLVTALMPYLGKRVLTIVSGCTAAAMSALLALYIHYKDDLGLPWIFIVLIFLLNFSGSVALPIPWLMVGEIFPVRARHAGSGVAGALFDVIIFLFLKTYFIQNEYLGNELYFVLNAIFGLLGCLYLFFYMPETEGKSLAEIEKMFSKKSNA